MEVEETSAEIGDEEIGSKVDKESEIRTSRVVKEEVPIQTSTETDLWDPKTLGREEIEGDP